MLLRRLDDVKQELIRSKEKVALLERRLAASGQDCCVFCCFGVFVKCFSAFEGFRAQLLRDERARKERESKSQDSEDVSFVPMAMSTIAKK
jgi:hypothetical protein